MANVPKLHHYLPEAYLRRFLDDAGALWVFDRRSQEIRPQRPENTGAEREMYTLESETERSREVEKILADDVDGPGLAVIKALEEGAELHPEQWRPLATFAASLYLRTPAFREQQRSMAEQLRASLLRWGFDASTASTPDPPDLLKEPGAVRTDVLLAGIEASRSAERPYQNDFVLMMVSMLPDLADKLYSLDWVLVFAPPKKSFVTCDMPTIVARPENYPPGRGFGITTPGAEKVVPLSPRVALLMGDESRRPTVRAGVIDRDRLRDINESLVGQSERFVYSSSEALLRSLVSRLRPTSQSPPRVEIAGGP